MKICPHCGEPIPKKAVHCKHCGSNAETGWAENAETSLWELPDYDEILENEFGPPKKTFFQKVKAILSGVLVGLLIVVFLVFSL